MTGTEHPRPEARNSFVAVLGAKIFDAVRTPLRWWVFATRSDYVEAYRDWMRLRIRYEGPENAVGGFTLGLGRLQRDFLVHRHGLEPTDRLVDVGCGFLRAGRYLLEHLDPGHYTGIDASPEVLEHAEATYGPLLEDRHAELIQNHHLRLDELVDGPVDVVWAHSLVTHLPPDHTRELLHHAPRILAPTGAFYATYFPHGARDTPKDHSYTTAHLQELTPDTATLELLPREAYPHPRGQRLFRLTPRSTDP